MQPKQQIKKNPPTQVFQHAAPLSLNYLSQYLLALVDIATWKVRLNVTTEQQIWLSSNEDAKLLTFFSFETWTAEQPNGIEVLGVSKWFQGMKRGLGVGGWILEKSGKKWTWNKNAAKIRIRTNTRSRQPTSYKIVSDLVPLRGTM